MRGKFRPKGSRCDNTGEEIFVAEFIVHESYNPMSRLREHNIALIRLQHATSSVRPICLPTTLDQQGKDYDGVVFTVAKFGQTNRGMYNRIENETIDLAFELSKQCNQLNLTKTKHVSESRDGVKVRGSNFAECLDKYRQSSTISSSSIMSLDHNVFCAQGEGDVDFCSGAAGNLIVF